MNKELLLDGLQTKRVGRNLFFFEKVDSTNACASTLASADAQDGTTVWAEFQTAGKGRLGRSWRADPGKNLMLSVVIREVPSTSRPLLPYFVAEAVAMGVHRLLKVQLEAKWPNDLLLDGKKCVGILIEGSVSDSGPFAVAGIGMNVNQTDFPSELTAIATSLQLETGKKVDRVVLFHAVMKSLEETLTDVRTGDPSPLLHSWKRRCVTLGKEVSLKYGNEQLHGTAVGLSDDGGLMLETASGMRTVYAGDVTLKV